MNSMGESTSRDDNVAARRYQSAIAVGAEQMAEDIAEEAFRAA